MKEIWRDIEGYEGFYQVSSAGRIRRLSRVDNIGRLLKEKVLSLSITNNNYLSISLHKNGHEKRFLVHRLVATTFIPNSLNKRTVNHKNKNRTDNNLSNLEWNTHSENISHRLKTQKKLKYNIGSSNSNAKLESHEVIQIKKMLLRGVSGVAISKIFNVSPTQIYYIRDGKSWSHIKL